MPQDRNFLNTVISEEDSLDMKAGFKSLRSKFDPYTVNVTDEEVKSLLGVSDGDKVLIADCKNEGKEADDLLPPYHKVATVETSNTLHDQLYGFEDQAFDLFLHIRRNRILAGSEAMSWVSIFYALIKAAATPKNKMPTAIAMFKRLEGYYQKRADAAKAKKRQNDADKQKVEADKQQAEAVFLAEKTALIAEKDALLAQVASKKG